MIQEKEWEWFGFKKHFIGAKGLWFQLSHKDRRCNCLHSW